MKVGFGKQKKKKSNSKKKSKGKNGDEAMGDAAAEQPISMQAADSDMGDQPLTAKEKQKSRMELKQSLKVKVAALKGNRKKLIKLAGNKDVRRSLNKEIKGIVEEQLAGGKRAATNGAAAAQGQPLTEDSAAMID